MRGLEPPRTMGYPRVASKVSWPLPLPLRLPVSLPLAVLCGALLLPGTAQGQIPGVGVRFYIITDTLQVEPLPALLPGGLWDRLSTPQQVVQRWADETRALIERNRLFRRRRRLLAALGRSPTVAAVPAPAVQPGDTTAVVPPGFQVLAQYADLNIELDARLESRLDRLRNLNCTAADISNPASGCQGGFPTPELDQQFALRAGGVIADRLHVSVDFDSQREFSANNRINVWYQGLEDDILRRVEVGNLDAQLPTSRFITAAIPQNSFGIQAEAQVGPLEFRSILVQQKGSSIRARVFTVGDEATQLVDREARDVEFENSRFFFAVNPTLLPA